MGNAPFAGSVFWKLARPVAGHRCHALASLALVFGLAATSAFGAGVGEWVSIGPASSTITAIAVSPASASRIAIGTYGGFGVTADRGKSWNHVWTDRSTHALAFDPSDPAIVWGAMDLGLMRSTDGGATYRVVIHEPTYCLAIDPSNRSTIYAGTNRGLYRSTDRGSQWSPLLSGSATLVREVALDPSHRANLWVLTGSGLRRSTDAGASWTTVDGPSGSVSGIAVHPTDSSILVATTSDGIFRTVDGGKTWNRVMNANGARGVVADATAPGRFYAWGLGWVYPDPLRYPLLDPRGVVCSVDDGATWSPFGYGLPTLNGLTFANTSSFAFDPNDHTRIYLGTDKGVYTTSVGPTDGPTLRVTSPFGGEYWDAGTRRTITWTTRGSIANVRIEYAIGDLVNGELVDPKVIVARTPNTGSYSWVLPEAEGNCWIRVSDADGTTADVSDWPFGISLCGVTTLEPAYRSFGAEGGRGSIQASVDLVCFYEWTAESDDPWLVVTSVGREWESPGRVEYSVAPNLESSPRTGRIRVGSASFYVEQAAGSETTEGVIFVPIVLDALGVGSSHYTSELTLTNRSLRDATIRLTYTGAAGLGGGSGSATVTLPAGRQIIEPDALAYLRRLGVPMPANGNRGGTLKVGVRGVTSLSEVAATVRTTTAVSNGRAGLAYAGIPVFKALSGPVYIHGLRENESDRSNLALQNAGDASDGNVTLRVTVLASSFNGRRVEDDVTLPPGGFAQLNGVLRANKDGYAKVERVGGTAPWYAYGVVNDATTSDGSFIPPIVVTDVDVRELIVPVVVETGVYSTELVVTTLSEGWSVIGADLALAFVSDQVDNPDHRTWARLTMYGRRQVILPNVLQYLRDQSADGIGPAGDGLVGALFVTEYGGMNPLPNVAIGARTWNSGGGGKYGLFYPATPTEGASIDSVWLYGLQQNAMNRTNLALLNIGDADSDDDVFAIDVYDGATGQLVHAETGLTVSAKCRIQVDAVLAKWAPGVSHGYAHVRRTSGVNRFIAYAVINDGGAPQERSGDGAFVPASD